MSKPLQGVRVIELATFIAAATAGRFMADLGADVIKIESAKGDPLRYTAPSEGRPLDMYENTTWDLENGNKRCISLNMKDPAGKEAFLKLLETADVLITNWRVQALERAGLDYESLKQKYPKLVYAICTGYGEYGPDKDLPGFDFTAFFSRGGYLDSLRQKGTVPMNVVPGLGDHNVGMNLAAGILAALYQAKTTGVGEKVETSLFESAVFNMGMMIQASNYEGIAQQYPIDVRKAANPFNAAWRTKDDRFIQTCMPDYNTYYKAFMKAIGREDLVENENYFPILTCQKKGLTSEVYDIVMEAFSRKTVEEWTRILASADVPFALAKNWMEIREDKQAEANNCFYDMRYSTGNTRRLVRLPVKFQQMGVPDYRRGPMIGEQGPEILKDIGYDEKQVQNLMESGTLYVWKDEKKSN
ncbi:Cinnamoyl-CoA:phenyllactate CoA-transferase [Caprobacter fermentans]|uniref:Cinnamoyl-CoA:phenyllactate CoA-transferase n=1 Tax=Caproicibacter fermentans TaxID=2576756 RepID=A0A6N8HVY5_9FIRM|nr:CoA transferase [Caproicibacter fermentans]MVB09563.1 Cinnamoyl-CoA:phenyllactate CoA-transferase [Caproicibacter fermentans]OCN02172.1 cinnamoyl-CoA:phenyllactate CoA-transferase [Clostridium sp. W14A]